MDVVESLRKIARELTEIVPDPDNIYPTLERLAGASYLIRWIADGLDRELRIATQRGLTRYYDPPPAPLLADPRLITDLITSGSKVPKRMRNDGNETIS